MGNLEVKRRELNELFAEYTKRDVAIAFSGGVDSSLLLKVACSQAKERGTTVYAYTIHTVLHPMGELELTKRLAREWGAVHRVIQVDELAEAGIENNPVNRCYLCKKCMFQKLITEAERNGIEVVMEGTNLDDTKVYRPGIQAIKELGVVSPLLILKFTKQDVRDLAAEYGISVSNRPSSPCLATRFPYNTKLDPAEMEKVEQIEIWVRELGFYNVRARIHGSLVRLEVDEADLGKLVESKAALINRIKELGYDYVSVDLEGFRSGSQDSKIDSR